MAGQEDDLQPSSTDSKAEVAALTEELQLVVRKEREAQVSVHTPPPVTTTLLLLFSRSECVCASQKELAALRSSLATQVDTTDSSDIQVGVIPSFCGLHLCVVLNCYHRFPACPPQCVLEQLVSEYHKLNDALRAEKRLYQNLVQVQSKGDR